MNPKISIVVPVYNVENYVDKCIESILGQEYSDLEIILIDDGSFDSSGHICDSYLKTDSRIILVHTKNRGLSEARNLGIKISSGDYIGFVDSDDWINKDMYSILVSNALKYNADISACNFNYVHLKNETIETRGYKNKEIIFCQNTVKNLINYIINDDIYVWNKLYKKSLFSNIRFPANKLYEDVSTTYKLYAKAKAVVISPAHCYNYMHRKESISNECFTSKNFDIVEAYFDRYIYFKDKYKILEHVLLKCLFQSLVIFIKNINIKEIGNIEAIKKIIKKIIKLNLDNCGITEKDTDIIKNFYSLII